MELMRRLRRLEQSWNRLALEHLALAQRSAAHCGGVMLLAAAAHLGAALHLACIRLITLPALSSFAVTRSITCMLLPCLSQAEGQWHPPGLSPFPQTSWLSRCMADACLKCHQLLWSNLCLILHKQD